MLEIYSGFHSCLHAFRMGKDYFMFWLPVHVQELTFEEVTEMMSFLKLPQEVSSRLAQDQGLALE